MSEHGRIVAAEFVGTAVLVMLGRARRSSPATTSAGSASPSAFGFALLIMAYVIGPISGCHINPTVTLGMLLARKVDLGHGRCSPGSASSLGAIFGAVVILRHRQRHATGWERGGFASNGWDRDGVHRPRLGDRRGDRVHRRCSRVVVVLLSTIRDATFARRLRRRSSAGITLAR